MKYLVFFLLIIVFNGIPYEGQSTVVYLQSSKAKNLKQSKIKVNQAVKCTFNTKRKIAARLTE